MLSTTTTKPSQCDYVDDHSDLGLGDYVPLKCTSKSRLDITYY